jgi:sulfide:quinone oxidoreductase
MRRRAAKGALSLGRSLVPSGNLKDIDIEFCNAGGVLFGVKDYVPALEKLHRQVQCPAELHAQSQAIDGPAKKAWFAVTDARQQGDRREVLRHDPCHPAADAPDFIRVSPLADAAGWVDVDQTTLRHKTFENIWSLGDVMNAPNAKTAAAARKQAPVVANNVAGRHGPLKGIAHYDGYGSCPLTVERGKIVLAEFGYGGKLLPSFPEMADRRHEAQPAGLAAQGTDPAADLLEGHAQGQGMDGQAGSRRLS